MTVPTHAPSPPPETEPYSVPDHDDYLTDGVRLVNVLAVHANGTIEVEDTCSEVCSIIEYAEFVRLWRTVARRPHGAA